jgi:hypothetical protein
MTDFDKSKIANKIKALMAKTEDSAATEAEAVAAAEKARELLDKYQLDLGTLDLTHDGFSQLSTTVQSAESAHIHDALAFLIADYTDTLAFHIPETEERPSECRYFGLESDVYFALWLSQSLENFILRRSKEVEHLGRAYYLSFRDGIINGVNSKLHSAIQLRNKSLGSENSSHSSHSSAMAKSKQDDVKDADQFDKKSYVLTEAQQRFKLPEKEPKANKSNNRNLGAFLIGRAEGKTASLAEPIGDDRHSQRLVSPDHLDRDDKSRMSEREKELQRRALKEKMK